MDKFIKNKDGIWDAPNCFECCADCSACDSDCNCPLDFEDSCDNCIFKDGYKKCSECCTNPRTKDDIHYITGYWHMCDDCIAEIMADPFKRIFNSKERNIDRIEPFLNKIKEYWIKHPDLRFMQVVNMIEHKSGKDDIFYCEEDELTKVLEEMINEK